MNRKQYVTTLVATATLAVGALVVNEATKPKHVVYFPIVYNTRETLKSAFGKHGIRFGFAVSSKSFENPTTRAIIEEHAAIVTTEVALKMQYTQPEQNYYTFDEADAIVTYADELGIGVHGHTASWSMQNPVWLTGGTFSKNELEYILRDHVNTLARHYDGKLISLDAANEGYLSAGPWSPLGTNNYVNLSFEAAQCGAPLIYNSIFFNHDEEDYALGLLDAGTIDGIGIQLHLSSVGWEDKLCRMDTFLGRIRTHGGFARLSEVGVLAADDQQQAEIYAAAARLAVKHKDVVHGVIVWGIIPPMWRGDVGLFDHDGNPKPSYFAVMDVLR